MIDRIEEFANRGAAHTFYTVAVCFTVATAAVVAVITVLMWVSVTLGSAAAWALVAALLSLAAYPIIRRRE